MINSKKKVLPLMVSIACSIPAFTAQHAVAQMLEEVVVTAQKRTQSVQDVPISVTVATGDKIQEQGFVDLTGLADFIPGLNLTNSTTGVRIVMRGAGTTGGNPGFEQSVASFSDGVYRSRGASALALFMDIDRIEILKGPQPTFFGQNAIAGALDIHTKNPGEEWEGYADVSVGADDQQSYQFAYGGPVTDTFGIRVALRHDDKEGYITNVNTGDDEMTTDSTAGRLSLSFTPTDSLTIDAKFDAYQNKGEGWMTETQECGNGNGVANPGSPCFVARTNGLTVNLDQDSARSAGNIDSASQGSHPLGLGDYSNAIGWEDENQDYEGQSAGLIINYDIAEMLLTSVTGYVSADTYTWNEVDGSSLAWHGSPKTEDYEQLSQELRLTSPTGDFLEWMVGAYWQDTELDIHAYSVLPFLNRVPTQDGPAFQEEGEWKSVFGAATFHVTDNVSVDIGLRYTEVEKSGYMYNTRGGAIYDPLNPTVATALAPVLPYTRNAVTGQTFDPFSCQDGEAIVDPGPGGPGVCLSDSFDTDSLDPTVAVQWAVNDDWMIFARYAEGFKSGGFSVGRTTAKDINDFTYDDEGVESVELGFKARLFEGRMELNATYFLMDFTDLQVSTFKSGSIGEFTTTNAAESTNEGIEIDGRFAATEALTLTFAASFLDAEYGSFPGAQCNRVMLSEGTCDDPVNQRFDAAGEDLTQAPEWDVSVGGAYENSLTDNLYYKVTADLFFSGGYQAGTFFDARTYQDDYELVNLRFAIGQEDGKWEVALYGRNLTDETLWQAAGPSIFNGTHEYSKLTGEGKTYGLNLRYNL